MEIEIEFISSDVLEGKTEEEKMEYIISRVKQNKILVTEEGMSVLEESKLIEETMKQVTKKFPGVEVSTLREKTSTGMRERLIRMLGGSTGGLTIIGPSKLIKRIKKEPMQISLLAGEKD